LRLAHGNSTLAGIQPYYHARLAVEGRFEQPYDFILAGAYKLFGEWAFRIVPAFFAILSFILLWLFLRTMNVSENVQVWILLAYVLSPMLVSLSLLGTPQGFVVCAILAGTILLSRESRRWLSGLVFFVLVGLSGTLAIAAAISFLLVVFLWRGVYQKQFLIAMGVSILLFAVKSPPSVELPRSLLQFVSDLGGVYGLSIFAVLLAIVGAVLVWSHKARHYGAFAVCSIFLVGCFFFPSLLVYANILIASLDGIALSRLASRKWKLSLLRNASLLVLFCGLLFSSISHSVALADMPPSPAFFDALKFPRGNILTHESYGFWIEYAGHKAVINPLWRERGDEDLYWDVSAVFSSTSLDDTKMLLDKHRITHVLLSKEMSQGLVWEKEEQGLAFLVTNVETFKKIHNGEFNVWVVK
jgi:hypothetical protein